MNEKAVEGIAYIYVAPVLYFLGLFGCLANLITLQNKKFRGKLYIYLRGRLLVLERYSTGLGYQMWIFQIKAKNL